MLAAVGAFSLMDAGMKGLSGDYPPLQVAALRGAASLPLLLAWALLTVGLRSLLRVRWPLHLLREESVARAVETFPDPDAIVDRNIETMERLGIDGYHRLLEHP